MSASLAHETPSSKTAGKYLTFLLGSGAYGIPILKVREIIRMLQITPIPRMPDYVRGVINLRGKIVPVIDLRMKFGLPNNETTNRTCIVVTYVVIASATKLMGLIVDALDEVYQINPEDIEAAPDFGKGVFSGHIDNIAKVKGQIKALLNLEEIVRDEQSVLPLELLPDEALPVR
jgi:purine-binding chemotaxis protein CheW